jgi:hypothetical protein
MQDDTAREMAQLLGDLRRGGASPLRSKPVAVRGAYGGQRQHAPISPNPPTPRARFSGLGGSSSVGASALVSPTGPLSYVMAGRGGTADPTSSPRRPQQAGHMGQKTLAATLASQAHGTKVATFGVAAGGLFT